MARILSHMTMSSILATVLFFLWRSIISSKVGVFFLGSVTMPLYMTGALVLLPACEGLTIEERLVRTSITASTNILIALGIGFMFFGISIVFYLNGLKDYNNAPLLFSVFFGVLSFCFLFFWPVMASAYFMNWSNDESSMYDDWQVWHLFPGLFQGFRVAKNKEIIFKWGIVGSLCGMTQWACLFFVSGIFNADNQFPNFFYCMIVLLFLFPALGAVLLFLSYHTFSIVIPQHILHPQVLQPEPTPEEEIVEDIFRDIEDKEQRRVNPTLMAYQNRFGEEMKEKIPAWHKDAIEKGIDYIILVYHKADGFVFCPSNLEKPFRVEGDYNGSIPTNALGALGYYEKMLESHSRTRNPDFVGQVSWFIEFLNKIIENKDFSLDDLQLETRKVEIIKGRWPWLR